MLTRVLFLFSLVLVQLKQFATSDVICCLTASQNTLVIGRASGTLMRYGLPHLTLDNKYVVKCRPQILALNCDSSRVSIIDINGVLTLYVSLCGRRAALFCLPCHLR